ncbi:hypothetical protein ACHAWF_007369 [Thalassiosira exigua]
MTMLPQPGMNRTVQIGDGGKEGADPLAPFPVGRVSGLGSGSPSPPPSSTAATMAAFLSSSDSDDTSGSFPIVLHAIVSDESSNNCIHWLPCGKRFVISDKDEFSRYILPRFFGGRSASNTKFTSFTRRLKRWNFSRVPSGREMGAYHNEHFLKGKPDLARKINYPAKKLEPANKARKKSSPIPKQRRRASTGSVMPPDMSAFKSNFIPPRTKNESFDIDALDISPTPIRDSIATAPIGNIFPMPPIENDLKDWLSAADFIDGELPCPTAIPSVAASVVSNSSCQVPPNPYTNNTVGATHEGNLMAPSKLARPVRRHSVALENMNGTRMGFAPMLNSRNFASNSLAPTQLLGTDFSRTSHLLGTDFSRTSQGGTIDNTVLDPSNESTAMVQNSAPLLQHSNKGNDPFNFSTDFSFDDPKTIDPFT